MDAHNEARTIISPPHQAIILNDSCIMNTAYNAPQTGSVPISKDTLAKTAEFLYTNLPEAGS